MNFWKKIQKQYKEGSIVTRLILINLGLFALYLVTFILASFARTNNDWYFKLLALPIDFSDAMFKPWTLFTYMFTHSGFFHLIFNMAALYYFGRMFLNWMDSKRLLSVYILGGLSGAALCLLAGQLLPNVMSYTNQTGTVVGASGSIYAIMVAMAVLTPTQSIMIPFVGQIKLKVIVIILIMIDVFSIAFNYNVGGHFAHLGGAIFGIAYSTNQRKGLDITAWFSKLISGIERIFTKKPHMKVSYKNKNRSSARQETDMEYNARKSAERKDLNRILDKIGKSGYDSLTKKEKEILFKSSNKK